MFDTVKLTIIAVILAGLGGALWYITGIRADLAQARENVATLQRAVTEQQAAISSLHQDFALNSKAVNRLSVIANTNSQELDALRNRFNVSSATGEARDFGSIAVQRPASVERLVNRGSAQAARCIELASGAPITLEELAATRPSEINTLCPSLANPNYKP